MKSFIRISLVLLMFFPSGILYSQVSSLPYQEGFEAGFGAWQQYAGDDFDWIRDQNGTPTMNTGPSSAIEGTWYVYTESNGNLNNTSVLYAEFDFNTAGAIAPKLEFYYSMFGSNQMGTLELILSTDGLSTISTLWQESGNQGENWQKGTVDLSSYASLDDVLIGFRATIGGNPRSDMAIDHITVTEFPTNCDVVPYVQDFNSSGSFPAGWSTDSPATWVISSAWNGAASPTGNHLNATIGASTYGNAFTSCFNASSNLNLHVRFFHYWQSVTGPQSEQDGIFYGSPDGGVTTYIIGQWNDNTATEEGWQAFDISSWADGATQLIFWWEISGSFRNNGIYGYWNIDDFELQEGPWLDYYNWTGIVSTDWNTPGNWDTGIVPDQFIDVMIPAGAPNYPVLPGTLYINANFGGVGACRSMVIQGGAGVTLTGWGQISIFGDLTLESGGILTTNRFILGFGGVFKNYGGTVTSNNFTSFSLGSGGVMSSGSFTLNDDINIGNTTWSAAGGTLFIGSTTGSSTFDVSNSLNIYNLEVLAGNNVVYNGNTNIGGNFTIRPTGGFDLSSGTVNVAGNTYFLADATGMAAFIDNGTLNVTGSSSVNQYLVSEVWHMVSAPISDAQIATYLDLYLRKYNEPTNTWTYLSQPITMPMNVTQGYSAWSYEPVPGTTTVSFDGLLNTGVDYPISSLSYTPSSSNIGWNLLGNPYPAPLQWNNNWSKTDLSDWACIHNNGSDECYNAATNTGWPNAGDMANGIIPSTQGFWVRATSASASVTIPASERTFSNQAFYKAGPVNIDASIRLRADSDSDFDAVLLQFIPDATIGYDQKYDLEKRWNEEKTIQIYSLSGANISYSVNVLPQLDENLVIPVGIQVTEAGAFSITATELENVSQGVFVVLEDLRNNSFTTLNLDDSYEFEADPTDDPHRFNVLFNIEITGLDNGSSSGISIYSYEDIVYVRTPGATPVDIVVYNTMGQVVARKEHATDNISRIPITNGTGYYIVKVISDQSLSTQKVFIQ